MLPHQDTPPEKLKLIEQALETLSDREQDVVLETMYYYRYGEEYQRLPNAVSAGLVMQLDTTPENIRTIRSRAMRKIKEYVEARATEETKE